MQASFLDVSRDYNDIRATFYERDSHFQLHGTRGFAKMVSHVLGLICSCNLQTVGSRTGLSVTVACQTVAIDLYILQVR